MSCPFAAERHVKWYNVDLSVNKLSPVALTLYTQNMSFSLPPLTLYPVKGFSSNTQTPCGLQILLSAATTDHSPHMQLLDRSDCPRRLALVTGKVCLCVRSSVCGHMSSRWHYASHCVLLQFTRTVCSWTGAVVCTFPRVSLGLVWDTFSLSALRVFAFQQQMWSFSDFSQKQWCGTGTITTSTWVGNELGTELAAGSHHSWRFNTEGLYLSKNE